MNRFRVNLVVYVICALRAISLQAGQYDLLASYHGSNKSWVYGWSLAPVGSNKILVGSLQDSTNPINAAAGAAYVMDAGTGNVLLTISNPSPNDYDFFGNAVLPVGNNLLIGAMWEGHTFGANATYPGAAYLFDGSSGGLLRTFKSPSNGGLNYGSSLAVVGSNILIGEESALNDLESVYLYNATTGNLVRTISNIGNRASFTSSNSYIAASGSNVLVGRPGDNNGAGGATLYDTTNGSSIRTFADPIVTNQDNFGFAVLALANNRFAISAPYADRGGNNAGAVYVFDGSTGALLRTFLDPNPSGAGEFGHSLATLGDKLLIGAPYDDLGATDAGAAYLFSISTGNLLHTYLNPTPADHDNFGQAVGTFGSSFLISAVGDSTFVSDGGTVYLYAPEPSSFILAGIGAASFLAGLIRRKRSSCLTV